MKKWGEIQSGTGPITGGTGRAGEALRFAKTSGRVKKLAKANSKNIEKAQRQAAKANHPSVRAKGGQVKKTVAKKTVAKRLVTSPAARDLKKLAKSKTGRTAAGIGAALAAKKLASNKPKPSPKPNPSPSSKTKQKPIVRKKVMKMPSEAELRKAWNESAGGRRTGVSYIDFVLAERKRLGYKNQMDK
jgi:hypothetical protein